MTMWVRRLIVANVVVYFLTRSASPTLARSLAFIPAEMFLRPWTVITYMFVHATFGHLFFNMLGLFFFGSRLEVRLGARDFLCLYFLSGLGGAVLSFLTGLAGHYLPTGSLLHVPIVGASGGVFGVLYAFARFWPRDRIFIWGIIPVQARVLVIFLAVLSLWSGITGANAGVAHFAHLGGFVGGWAYLNWRERSIRRRRPGPAEPSTIDVVTGRMRMEEELWRTVPLDTLHEVNRMEFERILNKLASSGSRSLTPDERAFMNRMAGAL